MATSNETGKMLEEAVAELESIIISSNPSLSKANYKIERNKILYIDGVKNEIDIYVTVNHGDGYDTLFIFECKNWKKKVSKNDIIIFSDKIKSLSASKGFFIAREFSKDALNKAIQDNRLNTIEVKEALPLNNINIKSYNPNIVIERLLLNDTIESTNFSPKQICIYLGEQYSFEELTKLFFDKLQEELYTMLNSIKPLLDDNTRSSFKEFLIKDGFTIDGLFVTKVKIYFNFCIGELTPIIVSKFDVKTRGRFYKVNFLNTQGEIIASTRLTLIKDKCYLSGFHSDDKNTNNAFLFVDKQ